MTDKVGEAMDKVNEGGTISKQQPVPPHVPHGTASTGKNSKACPYCGHVGSGACCRVSGGKGTGKA